MRVVRLFIAALLAVSLAIVPVSAAMARATHAVNADMTMSMSDDSGGGDDCPCCSTVGKCLASICTLKCSNVPAVLIDGLPVTRPLPALFVDTGWAAMSPFSLRPDPPPPRF